MLFNMMPEHEKRPHQRTASGMMANQGVLEALVTKGGTEDLAQEEVFSKGRTQACHLWLEGTFSFHQLHRFAAFP